jgi:hypothetical protein
MEELLSSIEDDAIADYMREAMAAYMAGAYRGCIVMSYIALFDYLLGSLKHLAGVNSIARTIYEAASKLQDDQQVFETYLIDQLTATNLLPELDGTRLGMIKTLRHKAAHPSGHHASAEEARFVFHETISRFLSKPILRTTYLVQVITERLPNKNFFPSPRINDVSAVVEAEIARLHESAYPVLVAKLVDLCMAPEETRRRNARHFVTGLASLQRPPLANEIRARIVEAKADDPSFADIILALLSASPAIFPTLAPVTLGRVKKLLLDQLGDLFSAIPITELRHAASVVSEAIRTLDDAWLASQMADVVKECVARHTFDVRILSAAKPGILRDQILFPQLRRGAGSSSFSTANSCVGYLQQHDQECASLLTGQQAFEVLLATTRAAEVGAFDAINLRNTQYAATPKLKESASAFLLADRGAAERIVVAAGRDLAAFEQLLS